MFLFAQWLRLPINVRHKIASEFGIIKRGSTHVVDNKIQSDGFLVEEVEGALTKDALKLYLGMMQENDMTVLWEAFIARMKDENALQVRTPTPLISGILPPEEAKQFKKEYKERKKHARTTKSK